MWVSDLDVNFSSRIEEALCRLDMSWKIRGSCEVALREVGYVIDSCLANPIDYDNEAVTDDSVRCGSV